MKDDRLKCSHILDHYIGPESDVYVAVCLVCGEKFKQDQLHEVTQ